MFVFKSAFPHLGFGPVNILGTGHTKSWPLWTAPHIIAVLQNQGLKWNSGKAHAVSVLSEILQSVCSIAAAFNSLWGIHNWGIRVALKWA